MLRFRWSKWSCHNECRHNATIKKNWPKNKHGHFVAAGEFPIPRVFETGSRNFPNFLKVVFASLCLDIPEYISQVAINNIPRDLPWQKRRSKKCCAVFSVFSTTNLTII